MKRERKYKLNTDELAVPEIITADADNAADDEAEGKAIDYEPLAMPELHIKRMK